MFIRCGFIMSLAAPARTRLASAENEAFMQVCLVDLAWCKRGKKRRDYSAGVARIKFIHLALPSNL